MLIKKIKLLITIAMIGASIFSCIKNETTDKISISASVYPLYEFAKAVGGEKAEVSMILPPGTDIHSYEPKPMDLVRINSSDIFIYISEYLEPWAKEIVDSTINSHISIIKASEGITLTESEHNHEHSHKEEGEDADNDDHSDLSKDPHIWLDFEICQTIVDKLLNELIKIDPSNSEYYLNSAGLYKQKLEELDKKYIAAINRCQSKTIITGGHFAFGRMAKRYGLNHISPYRGFTTDAEPSPQVIASMIDMIKRDNIEYIFFEELLRPKVAEAISAETGVKPELLHGAHNISKKEFRDQTSFISIMEENLEKLKKGLKYQ
ncbi:MAG TPA: zinc ABC transporter substrate-binding protein [Spirochaetota bacterium]|nr:zinc ABC transporter substrate-binding protein [Spirochaetota bacterium]HOS31763.1 zinc ABC transporter substrate-binding protein [Spirochaetota bacterium]HOS54531.1 zinc ABC transporter substrate-binding protein [Spirochaetota bacterium]HPK60827.1 zinc ABC transporter substrate-binding protein [Spirochaetota bacterium]HQF77173.1 zinc ABC transporter substrate-binding protein [Spirochaetota bacterium]